MQTIDPNDVAYIIENKDGTSVVGVTVKTPSGQVEVEKQILPVREARLLATAIKAMNPEYENEKIMAYRHNIQEAEVHRSIVSKIANIKT